MLSDGSRLRVFYTGAIPPIGRLVLVHLCVVLCPIIILDVCVYVMSLSVCVWESAV